MQKYQDVASIIGPPGLIPVVGVNVSVYNHGTANLSTLFSDNTSTATGNPLTTDSSGRYSFYAADGRYDLTVSGAGIQSTTITDIVLSDTTANLANVLASSSGAANIGFIQSGSGTGAVRTLQSEMRDVWVNVKSAPFGAAGNGVTDDTTAIQNAVNAVVAAGGGTVYLPEGNYKVTTTLNLANNQSIPVTIKGAGHHAGTYNTVPTSGSNLYGLTASKAVIETQGSHFVTLQDFGIYSLVADANKSAVGIFICRTTVQASAQYHSYSRIFITLADNIALNSGRGAICLYNSEGEHGLFSHCEFRSDTPLLLFDNNPYPYTPVYGTLSLVASCTMNRFQLCSFISRQKYAMELRGIQATTFQDCYWGSYGLTTNPAINLTTGSNQPGNIFFMGGQIETWNYFMEVGATCRHIKIDTTWAEPAATTGPLLRFDVNNNQLFYGLDAHFWNPQAVALDIIGVGAAAGVIGYGCNFVLDNGIKLNAPTLQLIGATITDLNTTAATVAVTTGSTYYLNRATGTNVVSSSVYSVNASTIGFFNVNATTKPGLTGTSFASLSLSSGALASTLALALNSLGLINCTSVTP